MAENQARARRMRNGAQIGGGHTGMDVRESDSRVDYDERRTVAWRSLDPFVESRAHDVPDWQPRD